MVPTAGDNSCLGIVYYIASNNSNFNYNDANIDVLNNFLELASVKEGNALQKVVLERSLEVGVAGTVYCKVGNPDFCRQLSY